MSGGTYSLETGQVRTQNESDLARGAHQLETASGSQKTERIRSSKGHSLSGNGIAAGGDKSGHGKNPTR